MCAQHHPSRCQYPRHAVIWRGTPADSPVKDQAACGSCWSFSSVGAIEAAWYRATGKQLLFSEQHMIDCGWEAGNSGCYGGWGRVCGAGVEVVVLALLLLLSLLRFASSRSGALSMPVISSLTPQQPSPPPPRLHARCSKLCSKRDRLPPAHDLLSLTHKNSPSHRRPSPAVHLHAGAAAQGAGRRRQRNRRRRAVFLRGGA